MSSSTQTAAAGRRVELNESERLRPVGIPSVGTAGSTSRHALLAPGGGMHLGDVANALRKARFAPIVLPPADRIRDAVARWAPIVAIVGGGGVSLARLLEGLDEGGVPVVLVGEDQQLRCLAQMPAIKVGIPLPADAWEVVNAASRVALECPQESEPLRIGPLRVDLVRQTVHIDGRAVRLPPLEFRLLAALALRPDQPISPAQLAQTLWADNCGTKEDVRRRIHRLRKLIGDDERAHPLIQTRRGFGYILGPEGKAPDGGRGARIHATPTLAAADPQPAPAGPVANRQAACDEASGDGRAITYSPHHYSYSPARLVLRVM